MKTLKGKRIIVTRPRREKDELCEALRELGADVLHLPVIRIEPPADRLEFGHLVQDSHTYDWLVFTSANGVAAFFELFFKLYSDIREIGGVRLAAIGPGTAAELKKYHLAIDLQPEKAIAEALMEAFKKDHTVENEKILIIRPEKARDVLAKGLHAMNAIVDEALAYRTVAENDLDPETLVRFREQGADCIAFASSSAVEHFAALELPLAGAKLASIGPATSQTMRDQGWRVDIEAKRHDIAGLVEAIVRAV